jgi:hypothetical protein
MNLERDDEPMIIVKLHAALAKYNSFIKKEEDGNNQKEQEPEGRKIAVNIANGVGILRPEPEVSQEERTWSESEVERLVEYLVPGMNSMVLISDFKQLTRKTTPQ